MPNNLCSLYSVDKQSWNQATLTSEVYSAAIINLKAKETAVNSKRFLSFKGQVLKPRAKENKRVEHCERKQGRGRGGEGKG
jgi:hypothetical protein